VRLRRLEENNREVVEVEWRSFLLRPRPNPERDLEKFRRYTESWQRPAADPDGGSFRVWQTDAGPPSHSIPPHLVAKAAAILGQQEFERIHEALLRAYFFDNRDITDDGTLAAIWAECGLAPTQLVHREDPALLQQVLREHNEAREHGATGVPAVRVDGGAGIIVGAHPYDLYERWIRRLRAE
jgi:predicted DsbA family dithiol-disulfide isomerase